MKRNSFDRKKRQLRNLANQINQLIFNGKWDKLSHESRNRLILKLKLLYTQLRLYFSQTELKKILAAAAIFIGFPLVSQAQSFAPPQLNPFGLKPDTVYLASPVFADIDHDGDFDLFSGNYPYYGGAPFHFFENTGTPAAPAFASLQENPFGITIDSGLIVFPAFADIDDDEDLDLFLGVSIEENEEAFFHFYENTGTVTTPAFAAPLQNPFNLPSPYVFAIPEFADMDNDGDLDLFSGEGNGNIKFYENTGTITEANFAPPLQNPFGITPAYNFGSPAIADIDHDGDIDLFVGEYYGNMLYFQNTGTETSPAFAPVVINPFGLVPTYYNNFPTFADLDDDGDEDLLVGEYYGSFQYFQNTEFNIGMPENPRETIFDLYPNPATDGVLINLKVKNTGEFTEVKLFDLGGRVVMSASFDSQDLRLKTDDLSPGVYFVRLVWNDNVSTRRLIIR